MDSIGLEKQIRQEIISQFNILIIAFVDNAVRQVWDFIFLDRDPPSDAQIPVETLQRLRREFEYWYPFDIRVSGKDLIQNHLTFSLYNHTAIFPREKWPKGFRCNGHVMVNSEKMSKSRGNFLTLEQVGNVDWGPSRACVTTACCFHFSTCICFRCRHWCCCI